MIATKIIKKKYISLNVNIFMEDKGIFYESSYPYTL